MKKICLVKWIIDGVDGGLKVAINLANELSQYYEVHIVSITRTAELFFDLDDKVTYTNFIEGQHKLPKVFLKASIQLRKYLKEHQIDVVMSVGISANALILASTVGIKTKTVVCDHLNSIAGNQTRSNAIQRQLGARLSDKVVVLTDEDKINYQTYYQINASRVHRIYNWMEKLEVESADIQKKKIVTVGRIAPQKGYSMLLNIANKILHQFPEWQWHIYGDGDEQLKNQMLTYIKHNKLETQLIMNGIEKDLDKIYPDKSLYVMTSQFEGLPLVLLEAKQYRLPIVSFSCPTGPKEIVLNNENGYLVELNNEELMVEAIAKLINSESLRIKFSKNSKQDIEKFDKEIILQQWIKLIDECCGERK